MATKNVESVRTAHECWNRRDFPGVIRNTTEGLSYTDQGRNITLNTRDKFREWTEGWAKAFSDGKITNPKYIDAGDIVVTQFTVEGTNDGPLGSLAPTGRRISLPFCEVCQLDKQGRVVSGNCYYDQYTLLTQLGHIQPLSAAA
jgi:predicted ester cyclase